VHNDSDGNVDNDFEYARRTYHDIIAKGSEAMDEMMEVARATEHPRAFEVLATTMKTMADVTNNLLDLHKKKKDIRSKGMPALPGTPVTNNNLFVGSTTDLQKMLMDQLKPKDPNVIDLSDYRKDE
jgi:hypothetical protein